MIVDEKRENGSESFDFLTHSFHFDFFLQENGIEVSHWLPPR